MKAADPLINDANSLRLIDPRMLQAFVRVARVGNVSRAAEALHLSQPAVSLQIKRLEDSLGLALFHRTPAGLALSRDGAALLPQAQRTLAALQEFGRAAQRLQGSVRGTLRVGTILDPDFTRLGAFLRELLSLAPELEPELRHGMSGTVEAQVARGELDVGYTLGGAAQPALDDTLSAQVLARFNYRVVAPPGWEPQVLGRDWPALARLPWIATPPESVHHRLAAVFGPLAPAPTRVALVDQESSMLALVRSGIGLSLARDSLALRESQAHGLVIADQVAIEANLMFICQQIRRKEPAIERALLACQRAWGVDAADAPNAKA